MTTTAKTPLERIREAQLQQGADLLKARSELRSRVDEILRLDGYRDGHLNRIYDLGEDSYVAELIGGKTTAKYGDTSYRVIVDGAERESRIYLALDHAILAVVALRNVGGSDAYAGSVFAARALGVEIGFE